MNKKILLIVSILVLFLIQSPLGKSITVVNTTTSQPQFMVIAQQVSLNHTWQYKHFMCKDFSRALVKEFKKVKINSFVYCGVHYELGNNTCSELNYKRFHCRHCWVIVADHNLGYFQIEPQTGKVISWEDKNYR